MIDPTELVVGILADAIEAPVSTDMPESRSDRYVLVDKTGDRSDAFVLRPIYALTCWGTSDRDAHRLAMSAVDALSDAALDDPYLSHVALETMSREEWSKNGHSRYLVELQLTINTDE